MAGDKENVALLNCAAKVGESFGDYLLLVRTETGMQWRFSDRTWAAGAAERFQNMGLAEDQFYQDMALSEQFENGGSSDHG